MMVFRELSQIKGNTTHTGDNRAWRPFANC